MRRKHCRKKTALVGILDPPAAKQCEEFLFAREPARPDPRADMRLQRGGVCGAYVQPCVASDFAKELGDAQDTDDFRTGDDLQRGNYA